MTHGRLPTSRTFWKNEQTSSDITEYLNKSRKSGPAALSIQRDGAAYFIGWCTGYDTSFCLALAGAAEQLDLFLALVDDGLRAGSQQLAGVEALALLILASLDILAGSLSEDQLALGVDVDLGDAQADGLCDHVVGDAGAAVQDQSDSLIICNGYKDESYIELALLAQKMGKRIFIVVEKLNELDIIAKVANKLNVKPNIGIRIKLASSGSGKWAESGGDASKFGLTSAELLTALNKIEEMGFHDCLRLIHFHIGSQITKIRRIQTALREAAQFYINLHKMGYNVDFVDCGGGLGVDYDGTRSSSSESSVNYSIQEYVNDCVYTFVDAANKNNIEHPNLITESGRSLSAHHSVLVIDVLETASLPEMPEEFEAKETDHQLVKDLYEIWDNLNPRNMLEDWHDAEQIREEALQLFSHGIVDLKTRAEIEAMYWSVCHEINNLAKHMKHVPEELRGLDKILADKYFCNFSLFQSLPDSWAIDQLFPIMPIQRLNERPTRNATLQDITCDSDGKIANFVTDGHIGNVLPLHPLKKNEPYYLGVFLVGAYQEILGDMHNLFGDTNAAHISVKDGKYCIDQIFDGETVEEVLDYVQYNPKKLVRQLEQWVTKSVKEGKISLDEGKEFLGTYRNGLFGYTYLQ